MCKETKKPSRISVYCIGFSSILVVYSLAVSWSSNFQEIKMENMSEERERVMLNEIKEFQEKRYNDWLFAYGTSITANSMNNRAHSSSMIKINLELHNMKLWQQFHEETTEMIVTKLGRRMFPAIQVSITGLIPNAKYYILVEISLASSRRQKYLGSVYNLNGIHFGWADAGSSDEQAPMSKRIYMHPDSPAFGSHWTRQPVSFSKLKLTNNAFDTNDHIIVTSMHKYIPKIWVIQAETLHGISRLPSACFIFEETEFIAVTAYQNENITKLKIKNNPFAKGFRETSPYRGKRKLDENGSNSSEEEPECRESPDKSRKTNMDEPCEHCLPCKRLYRPWVESPPPKPADHISPPRPWYHLPWASNFNVSCLPFRSNSQPSTSPPFGFH